MRPTASRRQGCQGRTQRVCGRYQRPIEANNRPRSVPGHVNLRQTRLLRGSKMRECKTYAWLRITPIKRSSRSVEGLEPYRRSGEGCRDLYLGNLNMSKRSSMAGLLSGAYGLPGKATGFGKLSRLRAVNGFKPQFRSMNFRIET
jgi:hypothetical protein